MGIQIAVAAYESLRLSRKAKVTKSSEIKRLKPQDPKDRTWLQYIVELLSF